jgi:hypothetical protein
VCLAVYNAYQYLQFQLLLTSTTVSEYHMSFAPKLSVVQLGSSISISKNLPVEAVSLYLVHLINLLFNRDEFSKALEASRSIAQLLEHSSTVRMRLPRKHSPERRYLSYLAKAPTSLLSPELPRLRTHDSDLHVNSSPTTWAELKCLIISSNPKSPRIRQLF